MVETKQKDDESQSESLYKKVIPKMNKAGSRQVGSHTIELKSFDGHIFIQITQVKEAFGNPGMEGYKPAKTTWITIDPKEKEIKEALAQAYKESS